MTFVRGVFLSFGGLGSVWLSGCSLDDRPNRSIASMAPAVTALPSAYKGSPLEPGEPVTRAAFADAAVAKDSPGRRVLVIVNAASPDSVRIGRVYMKARGVPKENLVLVTTGTGDEIPMGDYAAKIEAPVAGALKGNANPVDYMVTTRGVPLRIGDEGGYAVDAFLGQIGRPLAPLGADLNGAEIQKRVSPYFGRSEAFSHKKFGFYLVTRLTGYTTEDALALVSRALKAKPGKGPFLLDSQPLKPKDGGYGQMEAILRATQRVLTAKGVTTIYDERPGFSDGEGAPLMGYASWGSNDDNFDPDTYHRLRFKPGAIAETFVSTSGRTFSPAAGGQSLVADLVAQGVTGVKGYVSEPFTFALCHTNVLFDRYTAGFNLADSFAMASPILKWKDVVIGDPLCAPYAGVPIRGKAPAMPVGMSGG